MTVRYEIPACAGMTSIYVILALLGVIPVKAARGPAGILQKW
jgi:hypothetical protein